VHPLSPSLPCSTLPLSSQEMAHEGGSEHGVLGGATPGEISMALSEGGDDSVAQDGTSAEPHSAASATVPSHGDDGEPTGRPLTKERMRAWLKREGFNALAVDGADDVAAFAKFTDTYGRSPASKACRERRHDILQWLCDHGADAKDLRSSDDFGYTPLVWACREGDLDCIHSLIRAGVSLDATARTAGPTPMVSVGGGSSILGPMDPKCPNTAALPQTPRLSPPPPLTARPQWAAFAFGRHDVTKFLLMNGYPVVASDYNNYPEARLQMTQVRPSGLCVLLC
jgi:hypothetical protein